MCDERKRLGDLASISCVHQIILKLISDLVHNCVLGYLQRQANAILDVEFKIFNS